MRWLREAVVVAVVGLLGQTARATQIDADEGATPGAAVSGLLADHVKGGSGGLRFALGWRLGHLGLEGIVSEADLVALGVPASRNNLVQMELGAGVRYFIPVGLGFEGYVRAGLHSVWVFKSESAQDPEGIADYGGPGYEYGAGLRWITRPFGAYLGSRGKIGVLAAAEIGLWADLGKDIVYLQKVGAPTIDGQLRQWSFGITLGLHD
jgi:hypothetical protein